MRDIWIIVFNPLDSTLLFYKTMLKNILQINENKTRLQTQYYKALIPLINLTW